MGETRRAGPYPIASQPAASHLLPAKRLPLGRERTLRLVCAGDAAFTPRFEIAEDKVNNYPSTIVVDITPPS